MPEFLFRLSYRMFSMKVPPCPIDLLVASWMPLSVTINQVEILSNGRVGQLENFINK
jgi:hypothetical protein